MSRNNNYTIGNLLDSEYFSKHYKLIGVDLSNQIELEDPYFKKRTILLEQSNNVLYQWEVRRHHF